MPIQQVSRKLNLTRDQLGNFLQDQQQIRQFELLFATVDDLTNTDFVFQADNAAAKANDALAQIAALAQESAVNTALAQNTANQALALLDNLTKAVEGLQMLPAPRESKRTRFGSFFDTTTQTATVINTGTAITFNSTDLSQGVYLGATTSQIYVDSEGVYNFALSIQLDKITGGTAEFYIWFSLNGVNVTDSASQIRIQGNNAEVFSSLNYFLDLKAGDYVEVKFSVTDLSVQLLSVAAAAPHPGIPSIIMTVSNNIGGVQ